MSDRDDGRGRELEEVFRGAKAATAEARELKPRIAAGLVLGLTLVLSWVLVWWYVGHLPAVYYVTGTFVGLGLAILADWIEGRLPG